MAEIVDSGWRDIKITDGHALRAADHAAGTRFHNQDITQAPLLRGLWSTGIGMEAAVTESVRIAGDPGMSAIRAAAGDLVVGVAVGTAIKERKSIDG